MSVVGLRPPAVAWSLPPLAHLLFSLLLSLPLQSNLDVTTNQTLELGVKSVTPTLRSSSVGRYSGGSESSLSPVLISFFSTAFFSCKDLNQSEHPDETGGCAFPPPLQHCLPSRRPWARRGQGEVPVGCPLRCLTGRPEGPGCCRHRPPAGGTNASNGRDIEEEMKHKRVSSVVCLLYLWGGFHGNASRLHRWSGSGDDGKVAC